MSLEDVKNFFTKGTIGRMFLGGAIGSAVTGACGGTVSTVFLTKLIAAVVGIGVVGAGATVATGGILLGAVLGAAAIATVVAVVLYCIYKRQK